jgi:hypothetical protein
MSAAYTTPIPDAQPFARSTAKVREMHEHLSSSGTLRAEHGEVESWLEVEGRELLRLMLQEHLDLRAAIERRVSVRGADEVERTEVRDSERGLESVFGEVDVGRKLYQAEGHEGLAPLDAVLNLPRDHFSHGVRRFVAKEIARASYDEVDELIRDRSGAKIAKRQIEELAVRAAQDFDAFYELRKREREATSDLLVISTDGKGIRMRHEDLLEATRKAAEKHVPKLGTRRAPGEKPNKRMAQVAAVYSVPAWPRSAAAVLHALRDGTSNDDRPEVSNKRVFASVENSQRKVIRAAFEEAHRRDPRHRRRWVVLVDGDPHQLRAVKREAKRLGVEVTIVLDVIHVLEYIWKAARALFGAADAQAESWVSDRLLALLTGRSGGDVARTIRWWAQSRADDLDERDEKAIEEATGYLADRTRTRLIRYADALRDGLPIATGVIEGACRYLVKDRMERTGAFWCVEGAEAVLRLRALRAPGDFDDYWQFHLAREKERNHAARYANGEIPDPLPGKKRHLTRIK